MSLLLEIYRCPECQWLGIKGEIEDIEHITAHAYGGEGPEVCDVPLEKWLATQVHAETFA